jgi:hypothetical protein
MYTNPRRFRFLFAMVMATGFGASIVPALSETPTVRAKATATPPAARLTENLAISKRKFTEPALGVATPMKQKRKAEGVQGNVKGGGGPKAVKDWHAVQSGSGF